MEVIATILLSIIVLLLSYIILKNKTNKEHMPVSTPSITGELIAPEQDKRNVEIKNFSLINQDKSAFVEFDFIPIKNIKTQEYNNWNIIPIESEQLSSFLSGVVGAGSNTGLASLATKGLFKATADPNTLIKLASGGFGSAVKGANGKILSHAGFLPQGASIATPLVVFQALSFITGQYYMNSITTQLNAVVGKLDQIISYHDSKDKGVLSRCYDRLREFAAMNHYNLEHFVEIRSIYTDISQIIKTYLNECEKNRFRTERL